VYESYSKAKYVFLNKGNQSISDTQNFIIRPLKLLTLDLTLIVPCSKAIASTHLFLAIWRIYGLKQNGTDSW